MKKIIAIVLVMGLVSQSWAQETKPRNKKEEKRKRIDALIRQQEEGVIAYKKHFLAGGKLTSDGMAIFLEKGKANSIRKSTLFQFEIGERKHPKESSVISFATGVSFIYGKTNFVYPAKLGVQQQYLLGNKTNKNGVMVSVNYGGGLSMALLRPYEVEVEKNGESVFIRYTPADSAKFVDPNSIIGGPSFGRGWNGMKVTPGAYAKSALRFDYGRFNELVSAIEVGVTGEFYSKKISQMVSSKERNFFLSAYVSIAFGRRK